MPTTLTNFRIFGLHGRRNLDVPIVDNKLILVGENGTGKSTFANLVYYFLTRQWSRARSFGFDMIQAELNGAEITVTADMLQQHLEHLTRANLAGRRFAPHIRHALIGSGRDRSLDEVLEDPWAIANVAEDMGVSPNTAREYLVRYFEEIDEGPSEMKRVNAAIASAVSEQVLYLPTYRRIEQDLKAIFRGMESDITKLRDRLTAARTSSRYIELVEFGMGDVERMISARMEQVKESVRTGLNNLTGAYLREVITDDYMKVNLEEVQKLNRETLASIFARIEEDTLPQYYKLRLSQRVEEILERQHIESSDRVVAHFLLKLSSLYASQQDSEKDVRDFVRVCNGYLTGKKIVYDDVAYKIFIIQTGSPERTSSEAPSELELKSLSSGEKQIVSLFSHVYLSGRKDFFVIIDEPELSLSVPWQRTFLPDILDTSECDGLIAVTHSPFIWENDLEPYVHSLSEFASVSNVIR